MKNLIMKFGLIQAGVAAIGGVIAPIMYLMFMDKGLGLLEMGLLLAASTLFVVIFEIPFGSLADSYGRKKTFLIGEFLLLLVIIGFTVVDSFEGLLLIMALNGISSALFSGTLDALFVERFNAEKESGSPNIMEAQAQVTSFQMLGLALGAVVAGFLPIWFEFMSAGNDFIDFYEVNFVLLIPIVIFHIFMTIKFIDESNVKRTNKSIFDGISEVLGEAGKQVASSPILKILFILDFMGGAAFISLEQLWQPMLSEIIDDKGSSWIFGLIFAANFICLAIGQVLSIPLSKLFKNNYVPLLVICGFIIGGLFVVFSIQESLTGFICIYLLLFMFSGVTVAPVLAMFHENVEEESRSTMLSVKSLVAQAGAFSGALTAGFVADKFGMPTAWLIAGGVVIASTFLYFAPSIISFSKQHAKKQLDEQNELNDEAPVNQQAG
ncbi:MFS transporter [Pseudoalteromonas byunsanensis]|uniref:Major facilitator superfamily (MFS) profile domain-containing protein n=1 Tax=Pseudoalteromonas byunsanensis TaxID=327939 RepID=A0A1S1MZ98_9GAMM|nr:MFS transporter [Pseudoalteromonas byunsanensis]OHU94263.1 hypothetical protein BIW53_14355 [Pseudoalteromonas byunsanensis]